MQRVFGQVCFFVATLSLLLPASLRANAPNTIDSLKTALDNTNYAEKIKTYIELIKALRNIDPAAGIHYAKEAYKLPNIDGYVLLKAQLINEEGVCYRKLNLSEKALELHFQALKVFEEKNDSMGMAFSFANIGQVYQQIGEYDKSLDNHFKSLYLKEHLKDESQIAYSQNAIGNVLLDKKEYRRALDFFISSMAIRKKQNDKERLADVYANIGKVMTLLNRYADAQYYLELSLASTNDVENAFGHAVALNQLANIFVTQKQYDKALQYLQRAEAIGLSMDNKAILNYNYKLQKECYKILNKPEKALYYAEEGARMRDSLFTERRYHELAELQVKYETQKLDSENEILRLRLSQSSYQIKYVVGGAVITILLIILFVFYYRLTINAKNKKKLEELNQNLEAKVNERTLQLTHEIVEKQNAFNSLKENQQYLKGIYETSPFGIAVTHKEGKITQTNHQLSAATKIADNDFMDSSWFRHILIDDRKKVEQAWQKAHKTGNTIDNLIFRTRTNNLIQWIHLKGAPFFIDEQFSGMVVVMENITENKVFENELINAKNKAEESDHLKSAFLANMSHEIRTPMNAILGFSDLLSSKEYDESEKQEFINIIRSSGKVLLNLINDIIDISKIEAGELKIQNTQFNLNHLLNELNQTFKQQLSSGEKNKIRLIFNSTHAIENCDFYSDRLRLHQIFTNLLSNSLKFTQSGEIEFGLIPIGEYYQFFVKDTGIGIPEEKLDLIFQRFRQADDSHTRIFGGTGLGLAITRSLIQLLGGSIWVESVVGKGSAFYFTLPAPDVLPKVESPMLDQKTILIVEDVKYNFDLMQRMFQHSNATILHAANGLIAIDMALEYKPDFILMDIQMPEKDGIETMKEIKKHLPKQPIIAVSAFALSEDSEKFTRLGFDAYLSKPVSMNKLMEAVKLFVNT